MTTHDERDPLPVAPLPEVGSERLAAALAARDVAAVGQALRHDVVLVPILQPPGGETQNRVFEPPPGSSRPYELCLFSSAETFAAFLGDAPDRAFALRLGTTLIPFLEQHGEVLERVVFDPAGPHPVAATPADVLAVLRPQPGDDEVAWVTEAGGPSSEGTTDQRAGLTPGSRVVGFDLRLPPQWAVVELDEPGRRTEQVRALVKKQTAVLGDRGARLRRELREWLERTGERASDVEGRLLAFLLQRDAQAAVALSLVMYWYELGPALGEQAHLARIEQRLRSELRDEDSLTGAETVAGPFLRHVHRRHGAPEVGGQDYPLLLVDYWLAMPDGRGVVELSYSTPHVELAEHVLRLTDNILLQTRWVLDEPADRPGGEPPD